MHMDAEEEAWIALSNELGEALLEVERAFLVIVDRRGASRLRRDEALRMYTKAWSRLDLANRLLTHLLLK
jgi:hypothetical protein